MNSVICQTKETYKLTIWFTSDLHFGHAAILRFADRPWWHVEEMNRGLIERWNYHVNDDDTVYVLGDFAMGDRSMNVTFAGKLAGHKYLVSGNHDHCWWGGKKTWREWIPLYANYFNILNSEPGPLTVDYPMEDRMLELCHFPRVDANDRYDERYKTWRPDKDGKNWLLHGHTHSKEKIRQDARQIHVGTDAWDYAPVALEQLLELIDKA